MNLDHEKQLEAEIGRRLKALPELPAPDTLIPRVMTALIERPRLAWYRQPWPAWPAVWQAAALAVLLALFGGLCFAGWKVSQAESLTTALSGVGDWFSGLRVLWNALTAVAGAVLLVVKQLGTGFMIAVIFMMACAYASCVGLGTVFVRYARIGLGRT